MSDRMTEKKVQISAEETLEIKVQFTDKGLACFNAQSDMRPADFKKMAGAENVYVFRCTEAEAFSYFFSFADDVKILAPEVIKEKFMQRYRNAYLQYTEEAAADSLASEQADEDARSFEEDALYVKAVELVLKHGKVTTALLQSGLVIGYGRAARLIDRMEEEGIVSPFRGNEPRKLLVTKEEMQKR